MIDGTGWLVMVVGVAKMRCITFGGEDTAKHWHYGLCKVEQFMSAEPKLVSAHRVLVLNLNVDARHRDVWCRFAAEEPTTNSVTTFIYISKVGTTSERERRTEDPIQIGARVVYVCVCCGEELVGSWCRGR